MARTKKGHIRTVAFTKVKQFIDSYEKKLFIVRNTMDVKYEDYGLIHVEELSPSQELFDEYRNRWRLGKLSNEEKKVSKDWFDLYRVRYECEMFTEEKRVNLNRIQELLDQGVDILLVCFCRDKYRCHRKIIAEYFINRGYNAYIG